LLSQEKEAVRARDALNTWRRNLPMVKVDKGMSSTARPGASASPTCSTVTVS
jgi:predicted dithiol-disulfide oxidoreductase (DUF899 family)